MKKKVLSRFLLFIFLLVFAAGCGLQNLPAPKDPYVTTAYRTLSTAQISYDFMWKSFVRLYKKGEVSEAKFQEGLALANKTYDSISAGHVAVQKFLLGQDPSQSQTDLALKLLGLALDELEKYLTKESGGQVKKPLISESMGVKVAVSDPLKKPMVYLF